MITHIKLKLMLVGAVTTMVAAAPPARAHDTWLMPDRFSVELDEKVTLDMTSGMEFPELETGPKRARVQTATYRLAGKMVEIEEISESAKSLRFGAQPATAGIATFWVALPPKDIELKPEEVQGYLDEIAAPPSLQKEWTGMKPQRWRELYSKHQKTFVRVGMLPADDRSWREPVGVALEIVPEQDPTAVKAGSSLAVLVLKNGKPLPDFPLNAIAGGEAHGETRKTDAEGRVSFLLKKAGPWLLRGTEVRRSSKPEADWESDFTTLTLAVRP